MVRRIRGKCARCCAIGASRFDGSCAAPLKTPASRSPNLAAHRREIQSDRALRHRGQLFAPAVDPRSEHRERLAVPDGKSPRRRRRGDFGLFGQLSQLTHFDPTPSAIAAGRAPRVYSWVNRMEDLAAVEVAEDGWFPPRSCRRNLARADVRDRSRLRSVSDRQCARTQFKSGRSSGRD